MFDPTTRLCAGALPSVLSGALAAVAIAGTRPRAAPQAPPPSPLDVALVVPRISERGDVLERWLRAGGMRVRRVDDEDCVPEAVRIADVVVVDWSAARRVAERVHGPLDRWDRPTVFVGSSGARFAAAWDLPTAGEMARMAAEDLGPEMQPMTFAQRADVTVWRQGHLFHLPDSMPATLRRDWRPLVIAVVGAASRHVSDRPIVRHGPRGNTPAAERERTRRRRITDSALQMRVDVDDVGTLRELANEVDGPDGERARGLLVDLLPNGPDRDTTRGNWRNWLRANESFLVWDPLSRAWRSDDLARGRGVPAQSLRGVDRQDAEAAPDAEALLVARRIVRHYGGRAFGDLETFSCRDRTMCYMWDRRGGFFRMENHHVPQGRVRATPWKVSVIDTAADREVIWGGGGAKGRPRISARVSYRNLVERTFLPVMLLDPGIDLRLRADESNDREAVLMVRLAGRGMDLQSTFVLFVDRRTGAIARMEKWSGDRLVQDLTLEQTVMCGPLKLPTKWRLQRGRRAQELAIEVPAWNPQLPAGIDTVTEHLSKPRDGR